MEQEKKETAGKAKLSGIKKKNVKKYIGAAVALAIVLGAAMMIFFGESNDNSDAKKYSAEKAAYRDVSVLVSGTGTIQPIHSSTIVGMVAGDILEDHFEIGSQVEKDQVLYEMDDKSARTGVEQAELAVKQAQLAYDQAADSAKDLVVTSTVSGQISSVSLKKGDMVTAGMPVATVTDNKNMTIKCHFNEVDAKQIRSGQSGSVTLTATGETVPAVVTNVSAYTEVGPGGTLVQAVELRVSNPGGIKGGMAATARVGAYACQSGGTFEYAAQTQIVAKMSGTVEKVFVSEGSSVADGAKILSIDGGPIQKQLDSARIAVDNAKLGLRTAQDMLDSYRIKAPISGTVTQKDLHAGDNVGQVGTTVMAVISDLSALTFDMMIDELDISKVEVGQSVEITVDALPGQTFTGRVDKVNINGITANGVTNYPVTVMVDDPDPELLPGMNVSADIVIEEETHVLTIPLSAVERGNVVKVLPEDAISERDGSIDRSKAENVKVVLGINNTDYVEIKEGISEGDLILVKGIWVEPPSVEESGNEMMEANYEMMEQMTGES